MFDIFAYEYSMNNKLLSSWQTVQSFLVSKLQRTNYQLKKKIDTCAIDQVIRTSGW